MSIIVNGVELTEVIYAGVNLDIVKVKKGTAEAVTVFEKITQLATPQNVTANGTTVSWDAVENATSYAVLADGNEIGTVEGAAPETAVGTWLLNTTLTRPTTTQSYNVNFKYPGNTYITANGHIALQTGDFPVFRISEYDSEAGEDYAYCYYYTKSGNDYKPSTNGNYYAVIYTSNIYYPVTTETRIIQITGGADIYNSDLIAWLKANATKQ